MAPHRTKVEGVVELLSSLTAPYDPDGLDLYFSTESAKQKPKNPEEFLKHLRDRPAKGLPDFRQRFATIIEKYQSRFGKMNTFSKVFHPKSMPSRGPRPLSLYVLTDGIWDPNCTLITEIKKLVASLLEHKLPNKYVGIQFIRFGNDPVGKQRLRHLDAGLGLELYVALWISAVYCHSLVSCSSYTSRYSQYTDLVFALTEIPLTRLQQTAMYGRCF